ncbi:MAG: Asp-tRNA(Asn)/Glu-tRNA(Gln) amidotransferase subunit GatC [Bdellovibrionales bacterium]|jgi:aspartyl-tRNA(Asn)/glutamyl-tRNA(Gln) amidotransferase subunit C|nr:Asp-tRNA(Asn)/Glu-tRNA(Gln) amidotransferase subunit GatC [Bdellovibrionales bacterium]
MINNGKKSTSTGAAATLDVKAVEKVAELSRLQLSQNEIETIAGQLSAVLQSFEQLQAVDTNGVEPLVTPTELSVRFREDVAVKVEDVELFLANAPARSGRLFKVPPVV